jgi:hypothetical protein
MKTMKGKKAFQAFILEENENQIVGSNINGFMHFVHFFCPTAV